MRKLFGNLEIMKWCAFFLSTLLLPGCTSFFEKIRPAGPLDQSAAQTMVRDVPFEARQSALMAPRKRVLLLPFVVDAQLNRKERVAKLARLAVMRSLLKTRRVVVIRNEDFPKSLETFKDVNGYDTEKIARIAEGMGIAAVITGRVSEVRARRLADEVGLMREVRVKVEADVELEVIATKNGHKVLQDKRSATIEDSVRRIAQYRYKDTNFATDPKLIDLVVTKAVRGFVAPIILTLEKLAWEGRIAAIMNNQVYINAGRLSGLQIGDILKVKEAGEEIFDPETGELIGMAKGRMKGTIEITSYFGKDGAVAVIHSGSGFNENDRVEIY